MLKDLRNSEEWLSRKSKTVTRINHIILDKIKIIVGIKEENDKGNIIIEVSLNKNNKTKINRLKN